MPSLDTSRNRLCSCGSGKKYKKCCEQSDAARSAPRRLSDASLIKSLTAATLHYKAQRFSAAHALCREILDIHPEHPEALHLMGMIRYQLGDFDKAVQLITAAIDAAPSCLMHNNLGTIYAAQGRSDAAVQSYHAALALNPDYAEAHGNLANVLLKQRNLKMAEAACLEALRINPGLAKAHNIQGVISTEQGHLANAIASFRAAIESDPKMHQAHSNLGNAFALQGRHDVALECCRQALRLSPTSLGTWSNFLFTLTHAESTAMNEMSEEHRRFGALFSSARQQWPSHPNSRDRDRKLRIGFVSGDLRDHPVAHFVEAIWATLDSSRVDITVFSNFKQEDGVTARLKKLASRWHKVSGMSDTALAEKIQAEEIDILFDLSGHTAFNRLAVFARKPAPIQASWIGYPATTGLEAMDYYLADRHLAPPGLMDTFFTEKIVRLPAVCRFLPYGDMPEVNRLPALEKKIFTFGSFNRSAKLGSRVIAAWSRILHAIPESRMLIGAVTNDDTRQSLIGEFARRDIPSERLSLHPRLPARKYLELYHEVDLILDTFPYSGSTTSGHAIWMGVPIVTLAGDTMPSRQTATLLYPMGLGEFITGSEDEFVDCAIGWTQRVQELDAIRTGLRDQIHRSPTMDPAPIARGLEKAMRIMWQRWCDNLPAESFEVSL